MTYQPDYWQILKITSTEGKVLYKVFATWVGGYLDSDSWRMNSGITAVTEEDGYLLFHGHSGSVYKVPNDDAVYRANMYTQSVLDSIIHKADLIGAKIEVLPFETDFKGMDYD
jgi:hypothetical protein